MLNRRVDQDSGVKCNQFGWPWNEIDPLDLSLVLVQRLVVGRLSGVPASLNRNLAIDFWASTPVYTTNGQDKVKDRGSKWRREIGGGGYER